MTQQTQITLALSVVISLVLGMFIGAAIGEDFPLVGTAGTDDSNETSNAVGDGMAYYQISVEQVSAWLIETYPDLETDVDTALDNVAAINADPTAPISAKFTDDAAVYTDAMLNWSQAAALGMEEDSVAGLDDMAQMELPKDRAITMCLGIDDDPFSTAVVSNESGVFIYMVVPEDDNKDIPKEWEQTVEKSATDLFWISLQCDPSEEEKADA